MADKPSRALVLYGEASARSVTPAETRLHSLARRGICGLLSLTHLPPSENGDASEIWSLAELLDARDVLEKLLQQPIDNFQEDHKFPTVQERFMGMKAAIVTDNNVIRSLGVKLGFKVIDWNEINDTNHSSSPASGLLRLLGFEEGKTLDANDFDFVLAHVGSEEMITDLNNIKLVDHLVGDLLSTVDSECDIGSRMLLSVILSYEPPSENHHSDFSLFDAQIKSNNEVTQLFPCQSYMMKAGQRRENVRQYCPLLLAQYQKAVTRLDTVNSFSFRDFMEKSGNLITPADRFIHEVAFKLWKAPKYGA